jgi:glutamyl-tRNA synthetase
MEDKKIIVRFPPSPTGEWHFGNIRTFVFNYLFAKKNGGEIVMRFEDTDTARNKPGADLLQLDLLKKLGMDFNHGPYYQSKRKDIYTKELKRIIAEGKAYEAEENQSGTGKIIRLKNRERKILWKDLIKGEIAIDTTSFKDDKGNIDFIIARSIDDPLYHFTVVVDDWLMGITHVLRGEDHVTSTPRHILILEALGAPIPLYGHMPTIIGENKKKLGKRNGAIPVREYLEAGYLPDALLNGISLLGWNPGGTKEVFTREELIQAFSLEKVQTHPAIFTGQKFEHINKEHIKMLPKETVEKEVFSYIPEKYKAYPLSKNLIPLIVERIYKWSDIEKLFLEGEFDFFFETPNINTEKLLCPEHLRKGTLVALPKIKEHLQKISTHLETLEEWSSESIKNAIWDYASTEGRGIVLWAFRYSLSGKEKSPDPFTIGALIGKDETLKRVAYASSAI